MNAPVLFYSYATLAVAIFLSGLQIDDRSYRSAVRDTTLHICTYTFTSIRHLGCVVSVLESPGSPEDGTNGSTGVKIECLSG